MVACSIKDNFIQKKDLPVHRWYRFVLSFPPHLVSTYLREFDVSKRDLVLDPFCGTGTTLVECKKNGIRSVGVEAMPMMHFASEVKLRWVQNASALVKAASSIKVTVAKKLGQFDGKSLLTLEPSQQRLLITNSVSPMPMHKLVMLRNEINAFAVYEPQLSQYFLLALANTAVNDASNLHFGPEVGVRGVMNDADVLECWEQRVADMAEDLEEVKDVLSAESNVILGDARELQEKLRESSVDFVFTSPPYPNEKDYSRTTRLESVLLGFLEDRKQLRSIKKSLIRSNTRNVYVEDDDDTFLSASTPVHELADSIENRRLDLQKTSGFEKNYHKVTRLYFGGMAKHLEEMRNVLSPGAMLGYVVGDQASYFRVHIRTGQLLAEIAEHVGFEVQRIDLFRMRKATATRSELREEVVVLRWPGKKSERASRDAR